jgi:hypothetical protein
LSRPSKQQIDSGNPLSTFTIEPAETLGFTGYHDRVFSSMSRGETVVLNETFAYAAGKKECQFTATIKVTKTAEQSPQITPHWSGNGKSTGREAADCTTDILAVNKSPPYSLHIQFSLE